jgi:AraC-like DNA-binding protein
LAGSTNDASEPRERILPDGCIELIFNLADPITRFDGPQPAETGFRSYVAGQFRSAVHLQPQGKIHLFGVRFRPSGGYPFLRQPLNEFTDRVVALDQVWGQAAGELEEQIRSAPSTASRIEIVEVRLLRVLTAGGEEVDRTVIGAVQTIMSSSGLVPIVALADHLGVTRRRLEKTFSRYVGLSPKSLARVIRFQDVFRAVNQGGTFDWAAVIIECGYYDQAHLIKDFQAFCGQAPTAYFEDSHRLARYFRRANRRAHFYKTR